MIGTFNMTKPRAFMVGKHPCLVPHNSKEELTPEKSCAVFNRKHKTHQPFRVHQKRPRFVSPDASFSVCCLGCLSVASSLGKAAMIDQHRFDYTEGARDVNLIDRSWHRLMPSLNQQKGVMGQHLHQKHCDIDLYNDFD